jgi:TldD protein
MVGYVPDVLKSISMVSDKLEIFGAGVCGKGHKESVKAADGGPYIKARVRLG